MSQRDAITHTNNAILLTFRVLRGEVLYSRCKINRETNIDSRFSSNFMKCLRSIPYYHLYIDATHFYPQHDHKILYGPRKLVK